MKILITASAILLVSASAYAAPLLETVEDSRLRHNAERYETYKQNNHQAPLGGYSEKFGDTAPSGTDKPGYATSPQQPSYIGTGNDSGSR